MLGGQLVPDPRPWGLDYALPALFVALLVLQSVAIALGAIPAFLVARDHLASDVAGLAYAALWLLAPAVQGANLADFHTVALAAPTRTQLLKLLDDPRYKIRIQAAAVLARQWAARQWVGIEI